MAAAAAGPLIEATLVRMSQARETGALPAGVAGDTVLELIALARGLRARLRALG